MKQFNRLFLFAVSVACLLALVCGPAQIARAQQSAGSVTGLVTDSSGALIAHAKVTVIEVDRGTSWTTETTDAGLYNLPSIPVGKIQVKVEATGFATALHNPFTLLLNQVARVDFKMNVSSTSATVMVTDVPPLLQTGSTEMGTVIDANAASNLPLATRDINQLTLLAPGVLTTNIYAFESPQTTFGTGRPYVNGAREQDNNFSLDGMDVNQPDNSDVAYVPAPDAVQEFNIITSNAPADFGSYLGGVIVETLKSGTNQFHGNLYEYLRNTSLNANTWQNKGYAYFVDPSTMKLDSAFPRPQLHWNEFGGTVGGPIVKDKLFFFADVQASLYNTPKTEQSQGTIPQAYLKGDFSGLGTQLVSPVCLPGSTTCTPGTVMPIANRQPIPNNNLAASGLTLSSVASKLVALPQFTQSEQSPTYFQTSYTHAYQGDAKIDWQASQKDHVMGRYTQMYTIANQTNGTNVLAPNSTREYPLKNIVLNYVRTLTPTLVNEFRVGAQIFPANDQDYSNPTNVNLPAAIGLPGVQTSILPQISFGSQFGGVGNAAGVEIFHDTTYQLEDSVTWTHGRHSIHAGFAWYNYRMNDVYSGNSGAAGSFTFNGQYTNFPFADFLLGLPQQVQQGEPIHLNLRNSRYGTFVQDNYQATHNLTLNLGVRYDLIMPVNDINTNNMVNYDKITGAPQIGKNYNTYTGIANFQPRFGFAWQPEFAPNTVVRGAYDISTYMEAEGLNNVADMNPPRVAMFTVTNNTGPGLLYPATTFDQGYSPFLGSGAACNATLLAQFSSACFASTHLHATDPNLRPAVDQQWNLAIQHQFKANATATLGYVGNKIDHMSDIYMYNQKQWNQAHTAVLPGPFLQGPIAAGAGQARWNASDAISRYNALQAMLSTRNYHNLDLNASYTWSKCMANSLGYFGSWGDEEGVGESQTMGFQNFFQNAYNPKGDYGRCVNDAAGAFSTYAIYNLPFGKGKAFGTTVPKAVDEVIGGWQLALNLTMRSGFAISESGAGYQGDGNASGALDGNPNGWGSGTGSWNSRPNCVSGVDIHGPEQWVQIGSAFGKTFLNPKAVTQNSYGTFGNCQTGALRGPNLKTSDLNVMKQFPVTERVVATFQAQFINLTNTPIFTVPNTWWGAFSSCQACNGVRTTGPTGGVGGTSDVGVFGLADGSDPGRNIQLALKLTF